MIHAGFQAPGCSCLSNNLILQGDKRITASGLVSSGETALCPFCFLPRPATTPTRCQPVGGMPRDVKDRGYLRPAFKVLQDPIMSDATSVENSCNLNSTIKKKNPIQTWAKGLNRHCSKDIRMANTCVKKCPTLQLIREMQITTTMRCHFHIHEDDVIFKNGM